MSYRLGQWAGLFVLAMFAGNASAAVIQDATGEQFNPTDSHLDFSSVEVTNDAAHLRIKLNLVGNPTSPNWGKYMIGIDSAAGGTSSSNGWGRPITLSGMDYWIGSWVDTTPPGQEVYHFVNNAWARTGTTYGEGVPLAAPVADANSVTLTIPLSQLGLTNGGTINFDVYSSGGGGGDSAIDASSNPGRAAADWGVPYSSGGNVSTFTVVVPEPAALGLLGIGALVLMRRR